MNRRFNMDTLDENRQKSKRNEITLFKARQSMISTPNTKSDCKHWNGRLAKNNSIEEFGKLAKKAGIGNKNTSVQLNGKSKF